MLRISLIILSSILALLCLFMFFKSSLEMAIIPFYAEIWGTVSDWVMVAVTALTAYFLWKTLKSQSIVQDSQTKLTKLEFIRYRESILPRWSLEVNREINPETEGEMLKDFAFTFIIKVIKSQAHSLTLTCITNALVLTDNPFPVAKDFMNTNEGLIYRANYNDFLLSSEEVDRVEGSIIFTLLYMDSMQNSYSQKLKYAIYNSGMDKTIIEEPILQKEFFQI